MCQLGRVPGASLPAHRSSAPRSICKPWVEPGGSVVCDKKFRTRLSGESAVEVVFVCAPRRGPAENHAHAAPDLAVSLNNSNATRLEPSTGARAREEKTARIDFPRDECQPGANLRPGRAASVLSADSPARAYSRRQLPSIMLTSCPL